MSCKKTAADYGISDLEYKIICDQIAQRKLCREKFLKLKSDPCLHSKEAGYVFDEALQRFLTLKCTEVERFPICFRTIKFGITAIVFPMCAYGYLLWKHRTDREWDIRCGKLRYRDRLFKFQ